MRKEKLFILNLIYLGVYAFMQFVGQLRVVVLGNNGVQFEV